jgi:aryl-alcohol dehydrogenase-like predicted oxidoreductase
MAAPGLSGSTLIDRETIPLSGPAGVPIFGVGSLHRLPTRGARQRLLWQALTLGFRAFDVAPAYGNGLNEVELGLALAGVSEHVRVTTKFGIPVDLYGERYPRLAFAIRVARRLGQRGYGEEYGRRVFTPMEMVTSLDDSLRRLRRDCIDDFMIHEPLGELGGELQAELNETADRLRRQGKIRRWGVAGPAASVSPFLEDPKIEVIQAPLDDLPKLPAGSRRRLGYNAYAAFCRAGRPGDDFRGFIRAWLKEGVDVIVSTRRLATLAGFGTLFE